MSNKINGIELLEMLANPQKQEIINCSIGGECSKCGECCSNFLPVCQEEIEKIQEYVIKNNIQPNKSMLVMQNKLACPYFSGKKCFIYEVRPAICKCFYCYRKPTLEEARELTSKERIGVNMWAIAEKIEKQRSKNVRDI